MFYIFLHIVYVCNQRHAFWKTLEYYLIST